MSTTNDVARSNPRLTSLGGAYSGLATVPSAKVANPSGIVVTPSDPDYDQARATFNPLFSDVRPRAIHYCSRDSEVAACLRLALEANLAFRVRAGGHSLAGFSSIDGGMVIDVSWMDDIRIDSTRQEMTVGAGCTMRQLRDVLDQHGLLLPMANDPVGVGGYLQGAGFDSSCSRTIGLNSDSALAIWVMLADGRVVFASRDVNHDLWWAVRGGTGGQFGVLLAVRYRVHRAPGKSHDFEIHWPIRDFRDIRNPARAMRHAQQAATSKAPYAAGLNIGAQLRRWPDHTGGDPTTLWLSVEGRFHGPQQYLDRLIAGLRNVPGAESLVVYPPPQGAKILRQSRFVRRLKTGDWSHVLGQFAEHSNSHSTLDVAFWGGQISKYPKRRSSFVHRRAIALIFVTGFWFEAAEERQMRRYLGLWQRSMVPHWTGGVYQNFADLDLANYALRYWGDSLGCLYRVKRKYDPTNVFQTRQPIEARKKSPAGPPLVEKWLARPIEY